MFDTNCRQLVAVLAVAAAMTAGCSSSAAPHATTYDSSTPTPAHVYTPVEPVQYSIDQVTVPDVLVGTWDGDRANVSISPAGGFRFSYPNGMVIDGTVVIDGTAMTVLFPGQQFTMAWSVEQIDAGYGYTFLNLSLDGVSYVREV